jgi:hypothetical protein
VSHPTTKDSDSFKKILDLCEKHGNSTIFRWIVGSAQRAERQAAKKLNTRSQTPVNPQYLSDKKRAASLLKQLSGPDLDFLRARCLEKSF